MIYPTSLSSSRCSSRVTVVLVLTGSLLSSSFGVIGDRRESTNLHRLLLLLSWTWRSGKVTHLCGEGLFVFYAQLCLVYKMIGHTRDIVILGGGRGRGRERGGGESVSMCASSVASHYRYSIVDMRVVRRLVIQLTHLVICAAVSLHD